MPKGVNKSTKPRKERIAFTLKKDIYLLRAALEFNPWQLGNQQWKDVAAQMQRDFHKTFTTRTVSGRVELLVEKYKKEELRVVTGEEEETTERGTLLETIIAIQEEENAAINMQFNANVDDVNDVADGVGFVIDDERELEEPFEPTTNIAKQRRLERDEANKERAAYIDEAPGTNGARSSRSRLSLEDELLMKKAEQDLLMEKEKLDMERQRLDIEAMRVKEKAAIEKQRLVLEELREQRKKEEAERRDSIAQSQLQLNAAIVELLQKSQAK